MFEKKGKNAEKNVAFCYEKIGSMSYSKTKTAIFKFSKQEVLEYAKLDENLMVLPNFYIDPNAFCLKIYNYYAQNHKLFLSLNKQDANQIDIYSMNYTEVMDKQNAARSGGTRK